MKESLVLPQIKAGKHVGVHTEGLPRIDFETRQYVDPEGSHWVPLFFLRKKYTGRQRTLERLLSDVPTMPGRAVNGQVVLFYQREQSEEVLSGRVNYYMEKKTRSAKKRDAIEESVTNDNYNQQLQAIVEQDPEIYPPEVVKRVSVFAAYIEENPTRPYPYRLFESIEDFKLFHKLNPGWEGLSQKRLMEDKVTGGRKYVDGLVRFVRKESAGDSTVANDLMSEVFETRPTIRLGLKTIVDWEQEKLSHTEWAGKSWIEIMHDKQTGGRKYYRALLHWCRKRTKDKEEQERFLQRIFPDWQGNHRNYKQEYENIDLYKTRLSQIIIDEPERYDEPSVERVFLFLKTYQENPKKDRPYKLFKVTDDYVLYYQLHSEWHGKTVTQMQDDIVSGASVFRSSFYKFVAENFKEEERIHEIRKVFSSATGKRRRDKEQNTITSYDAREDLKQLVEVGDE